MKTWNLKKDVILKIEITIPELKALTVNQCFRKSRSVAGLHKSQQYVIYESRVSRELMKYRSEFRKLNKAYDPEKNYFAIDYRFYFPTMVKPKRKNDPPRLSEKAGDTDNLIKPIKDIIFKHLDADDSSCVYLTAMKIHCEQPRIEVSLCLRPMFTLS